MFVELKAKDAFPDGLNECLSFDDPDGESLLNPFDKNVFIVDISFELILRIGKDNFNFLIEEEPLKYFFGREVLSPIDTQNQTMEMWFEGGDDKLEGVFFEFNLVGFGLGVEFVVAFVEDNFHFLELILRVGELNGVVTPQGNKRVIHTRKLFVLDFFNLFYFSDVEQLCCFLDLVLQFFHLKGHYLFVELIFNQELSFFFHLLFQLLLVLSFFESFYF